MPLAMAKKCQRLGPEQKHTTGDVFVAVCLTHSTLVMAIYFACAWLTLSALSLYNSLFLFL